MVLMEWDAVVVESPFKGNADHSEEEHRAYLEKCLLDCVMRGETPYASHKQLTDCLDDSDPGQRTIGMNAGAAMSILIIKAGGKPVFYVDLGWSSGMNKARKLYDSLGISYEIRTILKKEGVPSV